MKNPNSVLPQWSLWPSRALFIIVLAWVSQQMLTDNPTPMAVLFWDKLLHVGAWGWVMGLAYLAYQRHLGWYRVVLAIFAYSILLETLQPIIATRQFSWLDIIANGVGCIIAGFACPWIDSRLHITMKTMTTKM